MHDSVLILKDFLGLTNACLFLNHKIDGIIIARIRKGKVISNNKIFLWFLFATFDFLVGIFNKRKTPEEEKGVEALAGAVFNEIEEISVTVAMTYIIT